MIEVEESCDASTVLGLIALSIVGLGVSFGGHRLYRSFLTLLGFAFLCAIEAANGVAWIQEAPGAAETEKKLLMAVCCVAWGLLGVFICKRYSGHMQKQLGVLLGALFGVVIVYGVVFAVKGDVDAQLGPGYKGWDMFFFITLALPAALVSGYLFRNSFKHALMLATAVGGALLGVQSVISLIGCSGADLGAVYEEKYQALIILIVAAIGFCVQFFTDPEKKNRSGSPQAPSSDV